MKLFDAYGREVDTGRLGGEQAGATMAGVRNAHAGAHPSVGLRPERLAAILRESENGSPYTYLELAEEMEEKDLHYLAVLCTRKQAVTQLDIEIKPATSSREDLGAAAMVREMLLKGPLSIESALFNILDAIGKGFSVTEIIWDTSGSEWAPKRLKWRDPKWFVFDWVSGEEILVRTLDSERRLGSQGDGSLTAGTTHFGADGRSPHLSSQPFSAPLAPFKFITHIASAKAGIPIRGGLARAAGWAYLFKNYILKDWVTFAEVFGQPLRVGRYHPGATEADKRTLLRAVANIGTDAAAIIPESMMIEFTQARQAASADLYQRFCEYLDSQVSKVVLGQTLTTELPRGGGSRAAAQVHNAVRRDILNADARRLGATLSRDLVRPIVELNLGPQKRYPRLEVRLPDQRDAREFAEMVALLADHGLKVSQKSVREKLGLSEPSADAELLSSTHP